MTGKERKERKLSLSCCLKTSKVHVKPALKRSCGMCDSDFKRAYLRAFDSGADHCSTLSGLNGETTNKDDVKGKAAKKKVVKAERRLVQKLNQVVNSQADQIVALKKKSNSKPKLNIPRFLTGKWQSAAELAYIYALTQPFHPQARGAKCLVYPSKNTTAMCITWTAYYSPSNNGPAVAIFLPNPTVYGWASNGTGVTTPITIVDGAAGSISNSATFGMNGAIVDNTQALSNSKNPFLSNFLSNYRVVGGGVKMRGNQDTAHAQINHWAASMPLQNPDWRYQSVCGAGGTDSLLTKHGTGGYWENSGAGQVFVEQSLFGNAVGGNVPLAVLPDTKRLNNYDILLSELMYNFRICGPDAFEFKDLVEISPTMTNDAGATMKYSDVETVQTLSGTTTIPHRDRRGVTDVCGWEGMYLKTAVPSGATSTSCLAIDYILHVEGVPNVGDLAAQLGNGGAATSVDYSKYAKSADEVVRMVSGLSNIAVKAITSPTGVNVLKAGLGLVNKYANDQFFRGRGARNRIEF